MSQKETIFYGFYFLILFIAAWIDWNTFFIPDTCSVCIGICGILHSILNDCMKEQTVLFLILLFLGLLVFLIDRGKNIGGGDLKLICASGWILEFRTLAAGVMLSLLMAASIEGIRRLSGKGQHTFPMGPYLALGIFLSFVGFLH